MEFEMFDSKKDKFTYHPETTPKYYLANEVLEKYLKEIKDECETERDSDTLDYIFTMERAHIDFCHGRFSSTDP